jgi:hypothetical protein
LLQGIPLARRESFSRKSCGLALLYKPPRGWRSFFSEVEIIVAGMLKSLGAEHLVRSVYVT